MFDSFLGDLFCECSFVCLFRVSFLCVFFGAGVCFLIVVLMVCVVCVVFVVCV